ncbi:MAG TPA: hypothetical protein VMM13_10020 [Euzebya sp.]|nr:hypothetical protein [Euzebya sp.]
MGCQIGAAVLIVALTATLVACSGGADGPTVQDDAPAERPATLSEEPAGPPGSLSPTAADDVASAPAGATPTAWTELATAPLALSEVTAAGHAGELWTAGGFTAAGEAVTAVQRFVPRTGRWAEGPRLPVAIHHSALASTGDRLLLLGGYEGSDFSAPSAEVWVLADEIEGWRRGPALPAPRAAGAAAFDGRHVVYGGGVGPDGVAADIWQLDGDEWTPAGQLSTAREHLAAAGRDGVVWFLGGRTSGLDSNLGVVDLVRDGAAEALGDVLPPAGGVAGFATADGRACMVGGEDPSATSASVVCVDTDGTASSLPGLGVARHGLAVGVVDDTVYVAMGGPHPGLFVSNVLEALPLPG